MTDVVHSQFSFQRVTSAINAAIAAKQDTLVSGTNIKTVNSTSLLGSGDIVISSSTAPLVLGTNLVEQRNGTNGQIHRWFKTYTSATNGEWLEVDAAGNASNFDIAAAIGSAGGTARGIRIGSKNAAGVFTPWLSLAADRIIAGISFATTTFDIIRTNQIMRNAGGQAINLYEGDFALNDGAKISIGPGGQINNSSGSCGEMRFNSTLNQSGTAGSVNFYINRIETAIGSGEHHFVQFNRGATRCFTVDRLGGIFAASDLTITPSASRTLATNGQLTFERVSDTSLNLVYRGEDGTTRRTGVPIGTTLGSSTSGFSFAMALLFG
jgi:hypothetical protein